MSLVRQEGSLVPQHWRNGAWTITGDTNPLPIENWIFNGTTWVPVSATNPLPTTTTNTVNVQAPSALPVNLQNASVSVTASGTIPVNVQNNSSNAIPVNVQNSNISVTASSALPVNVQNSSVPVNVQNTVSVSTSSPILSQTHVQNQSGSVVPVSNTNPMPIQIITSGIQVPVDIQNIGVTTTKVTLMAPNGIRDTNNYYAGNIDWTGYKRYCLRVENLLDQAVTITVQVQNIGDYHKVDGTPMSVTIPANTDNVLVTANELPILGQPIGELIAFKVKANAAPTTGTFTMYAYLSQQ